MDVTYFFCRVLDYIGITKNKWPKVFRERANMVMYHQRVGYEFNLDHPITFSEKIQWYKSRYNNPDLLKCVDKYLFKKTIAERLGEEGYTIPLFGVYHSVEEFRDGWDSLPEKFCLKSTLQSDGKFIKIIEKSNADINALCKEIQDWFDPHNLLINSFCCAYHKAVPRVIAEKYVENISNQLYDYKFFCFNGTPYCIYAAKERFQDNCFPITYYDLDWNKMDVKRINHCNDPVPKPYHLDQMKEISVKLSAGFPFVRVDFFDTEDKLYVAELTFYPGGGFLIYDPDSFNKEMGDMFDLTECRK